MGTVSMEMVMKFEAAKAKWDIVEEGVLRHVK